MDNQNPIENITITKEFLIRNFSSNWKEKRDSKLKEILSECTYDAGYILKIHDIKYENLPLNRNDFCLQFRAIVNVDRFLPTIDMVVTGKITKITPENSRKRLNIVLYDKQLVLVKIPNPENNKSTESFIFNKQTYSIGSKFKIKIINVQFELLQKTNKHAFICIGKPYVD